MDFLAAIAAAPDDLALRSVWADALQEAGDPRGELVALQLAQLDTYATWQREHALVDRHGAAWAGALGALCEPPFVFEAGVFAGARLRRDADRAAVVRDPAWPLVTTVFGLEPQLLDGPRVRRLLGIGGAEADDFLRTTPVRPALHELRLAEVHAALDLDHAVAHCARLPGLRVLGLGEPRWRTIEVMREAPVLERLATLRLDDVAATGFVRTLVHAVSLRAGTLRTIEVALAEPGWRIRFVRDAAPGPFTRVVAWWRRTGKARAAAALAQDCRTIVGLLDIADVTDLELECGSRFAAPPELAAAVAHVPRVRVPWA